MATKRQPRTADIESITKAGFGKSADMNAEIAKSILLIEAMAKGWDDVNKAQELMKRPLKEVQKYLTDNHKLGILEASQLAKIAKLNRAELEILKASNSNYREIAVQVQKLYVNLTDVSDMTSMVNDHTVIFTENLQRANKEAAGLGYRSSFIGKTFSEIIDNSKSLREFAKSAFGLPDISIYEPFLQTDAANAAIKEVSKNLDASLFNINGKTLDFSSAIEELEILTDRAKSYQQTMLAASAAELKSTVDNNDLFNFDPAEVDRALRNAARLEGKSSKGVADMVKKMEKNKTEIMSNIVDVLAADNSKAAFNKLSKDMQDQMDSFTKMLKGTGQTGIEIALGQFSAQMDALKIRVSDTAKSEALLDSLKNNREAIIKIRSGTEEVLNNFEDIVDIMPRWMQKLTGADKIIQRLRDGVDDALLKFAQAPEGGKMNAFIKEMGAQLKLAINPWILFAGLALVVGKLFGKIVDQVTNFSEQLGVSRAAALGIYQQSLLITTAENNRYATTEDTLDVLKSHKEMYGRILDLTVESNKEAVKFASEMATAFGTTSGAVHTLSQTFQQMGADQSLSENLIVATAAAADLSHISFDTITKDLVEGADVVARHYSGLPRMAAAAALETRRLGMSLKDAGELMDKTLNPKDFMSGIAEMNAMSRGDIDMSHIFTMRIEGAKPAEIAEEFGKSIDEIYAKGLDGNEFIMRKMASITGKTEGELAKIHTLRTKDLGLTKAQRDVMQDNLDLIKEGDLSNKKAALDTFNRLNSTKRLNVAWEKIKDSLITGFLPIIESIALAIEDWMPLLGGVGKIAKGLGVLIAGMATPFIWIGQLIGSLIQGIDNLFGTSKDGVSSFGLTATNVINGIGVALGTILLMRITGISKLLGVLTSKFITSGSAIGNIFKGLSKPIDWVGKKLTALGTKSLGGLGTKISDFVKKYTGRLSGVFNTAAPAAGTAAPDPNIPTPKGKLGKVIDWMTEKLAKLKDAISDKLGQAIEWIGTKIRNFFKMLGKLKPKDILMSVGALIGLAGAFSIIAYSMKEFAGGMNMLNTVDTSSWVGIASVLGIMGLALLAFSAIAKSGYVWLGIAAILALAAAFVIVGYGTKLFAEGFAKMDGLDWGSLAKGFIDISGAMIMLSIGIGALAVSLAVLGAAAPLILIGTAAIAAGIWLIRKAAGDGLDKIFSPLIGLSKSVDGNNLKAIGSGLKDLALGFLALTAGKLVSFFSGDPLKPLRGLAELAQPLDIVANALSGITSNLKLLNDVLANLDLAKLKEFKAAMGDSMLKTISVALESVVMPSKTVLPKMKENYINPPPVADNLKPASYIPPRPIEYISSSQAAMNSEAASKVRSNGDNTPGPTAKMLMNELKRLNENIMMSMQRPVVAHINWSPADTRTLNQKLKARNNN